MAKNRLRWTSFAVTAGLLALILDAKTALSGAADGITLCIYTIVPSLFPFFVLTSFLNSSLSQFKMTLLQPIGRLCAIPKGTESILLLGLLGGYPVGAQCIADAYHSGNISKDTAERMLGFCSNAGPAFIFGMMGSLFGAAYIPWLLWIIHMLSALITGALLPKCNENHVILTRTKPLTISQSVLKSVKNISLVCGWVIIFRVLIIFLERWFFRLLPNESRVIVTGILELSNGAWQLNQILQDGCKFILGAFFLGFGGLCVAMQTSAATEGLDTAIYFLGKLIQSAFSFLLAYILQYALFPANERWNVTLILPIIFLGVFISSIIYVYKNNSRNFVRSVV